MTLEGTFADMPLIDLLHIFQSSRKTGRLLIAHRPYKAMLWFFDGALVNAAVVAQPGNERATCGEEAVFALLHWDDGVFKFIAPQPGVTLDDWRVLSHLVAEASVDEVVPAVDYTLEQTLGIINRLIALNLVEIRAEIVQPQSRPIVYLPPVSDQRQQAPQQRMRHLAQSIKDRLRRVSA